MSRNIPPGGSIPTNVRGEKQAWRKKATAYSQKPRRLSVCLGRKDSKRPIVRRPADITEPYCIPSKPIAKKRLCKGTLDRLLTWGQQEEQRCINVLRTMPPDLPEYDEVLEKYSKLQQMLDQVKRQLAAGR